jgi:hypothetical protein
MMRESRSRYPRRHGLARREIAGLALGKPVQNVGTEKITDLVDFPVHCGDSIQRAAAPRGTAPAPARECPLEAAGFRAETGQNGWRWRGIVDGFAVKLEFLCDLDSEREGIVAIPGCRVLRANNLRGTGYVAADWTLREMTTDLPGLGTTTVRVRFAGLEGYLLTKCVAVRYRGKDKDHYDLAFVLLHNRAGGPDAAARRLLNGKLADRLPALRSTFLEVRERFHAVTSPGSKGFAAEALRADPSAAEDEMRARAAAAVDGFIKALLAKG